MNKNCFIITPIGEEASETREKAEGVIEAITPVLIELGYILHVPHRMPSPGSITKQVLECIINHELVIANLTELNPNVMYELAVRHSTAKHVITIAENGTKLPFDITTERTIFYSNDMRGVPKLQKEIRSAIKSIDTEKSEFDNPIYRAQKDFKLKETITGSTDGYIIEQLDNMREINLSLLETVKDLLKFDRPTIRIIKASADFGVPLNKLVNYLEEIGYIIESNPNTKITSDIYNILKNKFGTKKQLVVKGAIDLGSANIT